MDKNKVRAKMLLVLFIFFYFISYYVYSWRFIYYALGLIFTLVISIRIYSHKSVIRIAVYSSLALLGLLAGAQLRQRAERSLNTNLGMPLEQIRVFYGKVIEDSRPTWEKYGESFHFKIQVFATGDGKTKLVSASAQIFAKARLPNSMPSLGQIVAVQATIRSFSRDGHKVLYSRIPKKAIQLYLPEELQDLGDLAIHSKSLAYQLGKNQPLRNSKQKFLSLVPWTSWSPRIFGVSWTSWMKAALQAALGKDTTYSQHLWSWRAGVRHLLFNELRSLFPAEGRNLFLALLFGVSTELSQEVKDYFRLSGCMHILALSGFHVGILAGIVSFLLRPLLGFRRALLGSSLILAAYLFLVGPLPSLTRAVLMFFLLNFCKFWLWRGDTLIIWAVSALVQTQLFPLAAISLSFQLSYAALLGLILFAGRSNTFILIIHYKLFGDKKFFLLAPIVRVFLQGIAMTLAVLLCTSPILLMNFGQIRWIGILASLVETPIIMLYIWLSILLWPFAYLLRYLEWNVLLLQVQELYRDLYHISLAPMKFFSKASPWQFHTDLGSWLPLPLWFYLGISMLLLGIFYRYELWAASRYLRRLLKAIKKLATS